MAGPVGIAILAFVAQRSEIFAEIFAEMESRCGLEQCVATVCA